MTSRNFWQIFWKIIVSLIVASGVASAVLALVSFVAGIAFSENNSEFGAGGLFFLFIVFWIYIAVMTVVQVLILELLARYKKWPRGMAEPICGAVMAPVLYILLVQPGQYSFIEKFSKATSEMYLGALLFVFVGAVGGYVYHWMNKKLGNL